MHCHSLSLKTLPLPSEEAQVGLLEDEKHPLSHLITPAGSQHPLGSRDAQLTSGQPQTQEESQRITQLSPPKLLTC